MKKVLLVLVGVAATLAFAPTALGAVFYTYSGYFRGVAPRVPIVGQAASATIKAKSITLTWGDAAGWVGVSNGVTCPSGGPCPGAAWIQTGIYKDSSSFSLYIEYKVYGQSYPVFTSMGTPSFNVSYPVSVMHVSSGQWKATVNGATLGTITTGGSMTATDYTSEGANDDTLINPTAAMDFVFSNTLPWGTSALIPERNNDHDVLTNITSNGFEALQYSYGGGTCQPQCNGPIESPGP